MSLPVYFVVLLGAAALCASVDATSDPTVKTNFLRPLVAITGDTNRFLRAVDISQQDDEERVISIKTLPVTQKISTRTTEKLAKYLGNKESASFVFGKLKLKATGTSILENPNFVAWVSYVDDFNKKNLENKISTIPTLREQYGDEGLAKMLEAAKQAKNTNDIASKLQGEHMKVWKSEGLSTDKLFETYKLDDGVANLLANPGVNIWIRYADEFNPGEKTTLFDKLQATYKDSTLSQLLIAGMKVSSTEQLATKLQNQQIQTWLGRGEAPGAVFKLLMLDKGTDNIFANPQFKTWLNYATTFQRKNPDATKVPVIDTLMAQYSDIALSRMIKTAKETSGTKSMATYMEKTLLAKWLKEEKTPTYISSMLDRQVTPDDAFKLLMLDKATDNVFANPEYGTWLTYATAFKNQNPGITSKPVIDTLTAHFSDQVLSRMIKTAKQTSGTKSMATYMEKTLLAKWLKEEKTPAYISSMLDRQVTPDDAFKLLMLDKATDNVFANPEYGTWLTYATAFKNQNPGITSKPVIDTLTAHFSDQVLSRMIKTAKQTSGTKSMATYMEKTLVGKWATDGRSPAYVINKLGTTKEDKRDLLSAFMKQVRKAEEKNDVE